jgi:hypothetical protein
MSSYPELVKGKLMAVIKNLEQRKDQFVKHPGKDFTRKRKLSFHTLITLMLSMGGKSLENELLEFFDYSLDTVSSSAFIQNRNKLLPETFEVLFHEFNNCMDDLKTLEGYRLIAVDGSDLNISHDFKDQETYFQSTPDSKGFNQIHINAMYDLINNAYLDAYVQPGRKVNEARALNDMVDRSVLTGKVLVIADRGYESYNVFAHIMKKGWKFLIRVKDTKSQGMLSSFKLPDTGEFDRSIKRILTRKQTKTVKSQPDVYKFLPASSTFDYFNCEDNEFYPMSFRVVRVALEDGSYQCFVTNLDSTEASLEQIREYYHMRWGVETSFRQIKHALALTHLHAKKVEYIVQEIFAKMVMYNFCSIITSHVVIQKKQRRHCYQVNFSKAISICKNYFKSFNVHPPNVEALIQKYILPIRNGRSSPRNVRPRTFVSFNYRIA